MKEERFQAGEFDRKGTLSMLGEKDAQGHASKKNLVPITENIHCKKEEVNGDENNTEAGRQTAFGRVDFVIRWRADVKPVHVWSCEGVNYDIKAVLEIRRRMYLKLQCQRRD